MMAGFAGMATNLNGYGWKPGDPIPTDPNALPATFSMPGDMPPPTSVASGAGARMFGAGFRPPVGAPAASLSMDGLDGMATAPATLPTPELPAGMFGGKSVPKPSFFGQGGTGRDIAGLIGMSLLSATNPQLGAAMVNGMTQRRQDADRYAFELAKYQLEQAAPKFEKVGNDLVSYRQDGVGGVNVAYTGKTDAEAYAASLGYPPGSPQYQTAMQDFALKTAGPTALGVQRDNIEADNARADAQLAEQRGYHTATIGLGHARLGLEGQRVGLEGQRVQIARTNSGEVTPGKVIGPLLDKVRRGQPLTAGEQQAFQMYRQTSPMDAMINAAMMAGAGTPGGMAPPMSGARSPTPTRQPGAGGGLKVGQTATGPGGRKITWNGQRWVG